jgi:hypothetical protein
MMSLEINELSEKGRRGGLNAEDAEGRRGGFYRRGRGETQRMI